MFAAAPIGDWAAGLAPLPSLSVSEWAERYRRLPERSAARGGMWRNQTCPYLVEIMDSTIAPGVTRMVVVKAAQVGASEALTNVIAYHVAQRPCPVLVVQPTMAAAHAYAKERLEDCFRTSPEVGRMVHDKRAAGEPGRPESTLSLKMFAGGFIALAGGSSPNSYARWSVRLAIVDDADRIPRFVGSEGDPTALIVNRTTSFHDGLVIFCSTPVLAGGRISALYAESDQRRFFVTCPRCRRADYIRWNDAEHWRVAFDERTPSTARLECPCGHRIYEPDRESLIAAGRWQATAEPLAPGYRGYSVPSMLSPFISLEQLATKFLSAVVGGGPRALREFVSTALGEGWEDPATRIDPSDLVGRLEDF